MKQTWKKLIIIALSCSLMACGGAKRDAYKGMSAAAIYAQAQTHLEKENFGKAVKDFEALDARYPYGEYADKGQIGLIYAYYKHEEFVPALAAADRFIRMQPNHPQIDYIFYLKGLINYDQNLSFIYRHVPLQRSSREPLTSREALTQFKELCARFPQSQYVPEAQKRIQYLELQSADYELHVAQYYMKRHAYLAVINRANQILKSYPHTTTAAQALELLQNAYQALGMKELAEDAKQRLLREFPSSTPAKNMN